MKFTLLGLDGNFMGVSYIHTYKYIYIHIYICIITSVRAKSNGQFLDSNNACCCSMHIAMLYYTLPINLDNVDI